MNLPLSWFSLLPLLCGCAVEEINFVTSNSVESSADAGAGSARDCSAREDCEPGELCELPSCLSPRGSCRRRPLAESCGSALDPVCGCEGVTYFNDCLRAASGVPAATPGACLRNPRYCGGGVAGTGPCPEGLLCARLFPLASATTFLSLAQTLPQLPGVCWVLPESCDAEPGNDVWVSIADGEVPHCVDTCNAIRSEQPHVPTASCP